MIPPVTDDTMRTARRSEDPHAWHPVRRDPHGLLATAGLLLALAQSGAAQPASQPGPGVPSPGGPKLVASVRDMSEATQSITIPLNKSVIIETAVPLERVQAISADIAYVQTISPVQFLVTGNSYGVTQIIAWASDGRQHVFEVTVELDLKTLNETIPKIDPQATAQAQAVMGNIVLTGAVSGPDKAKRIVELAGLFVPRTGTGTEVRVQNQMNVTGEQQVLLHCTVAEVNRTAVRTLGINGFLAGDDFQDAFVVNQIGTINPINIGAAAGVDVTGRIPFLTGENGIPLQPSTTLSLGFPRVQMQLFLKALADNSLLRILAEPNLVAISGETASFLAGGEFPIPVPQSGAATGAITIEYKEFGVRLNFTPLVLDHQRIRLRIAPEVSETDFSTAVQIAGFTVPALTQRRAETTVEVGNGQTLAMAGLLDDEVRGVVSRVPGIGDVPVLGALFRSTEYRRRVTELVILVTPEVVAPMNPDQVLPVPGQFLTTPNDFELYALGLLEGPTEKGPSSPSGALSTHAPPRVSAYSRPEELSIHGPWGHETKTEVQ